MKVQHMNRIFVKYYCLTQSKIREVCNGRVLDEILGVTVHTLTSDEGAPGPQSLHT